MRRARAAAIFAREHRTQCFLLKSLGAKTAGCGLEACANMGLAPAGPAFKLFNCSYSCFRMDKAELWVRLFPRSRRRTVPSLDVASGIAMIPEWAVAPSFIVAGGMPGAIRDVDVRHFHQNIRVLQRRGQERAAEGRGNEGEVLVSKMPRSCLAGMRPPCVQRRLCEGSWLALRTALLHRPKSQPRSWREQAHV